MQGNHVTLQRLSQTDKRRLSPRFPFLPRRVKQAYLKTKAFQALSQLATDITNANDTNRQGCPIVQAPSFSKQRYYRQHIFGHTAGVASWGGGKADALRLQPLQVNMVCTNGGSAHKTNPASFQQLTVNAGHRTHQQDIRILHLLTTQRSPCNPAYFSNITEERVQ